MGNHCNICSFNCWGREGYDASCCTLEDRNWIIGPHTDAPNYFWTRLSDRVGRKVSVLRNLSTIMRKVTKSSLIKKFGKVLIHYPALRVDEENKRLPCVNYNIATRSCMVYDIRPQICRDFICDYLERELLMNE